MQRGRLNEACVGRNSVTFFEEDDVPRHDVRGLDGLAHAIANDARLRRRHLPQRRNRLFGARLLHVTHDCVHEHHGQDRDRFIRQRGIPLDRPERGGDRRRDQQQDHENVLELRQEFAPGGRRLLSRQNIAAILL